MAVEDGAVAPKRSRGALVALVLGVISLLVSPILIFAQYVVLIGVAMLSSDQGTDSLDSIIIITIFAGFAVIVIGLPVAALLIGLRSRKRIRYSSEPLSGLGAATAGSILGAIALLIVALGELFMALSLAGVCSLDGCG